MSTYNFSIELTYEEICTAIRIYKDAIAYHNFTLEYCKKHLLLLEETIKNRDTDIKGDKKEFLIKSISSAVTVGMMQRSFRLRAIFV